MRRPVGNSQSRRSGELNMTPMIDVVFLLIIFFLVSSHLARRESRLALDLPTAATGQADDDPSPRLTINVAADGTLSLGTEAIEPAQLVERLRSQAEDGGDTLRVRLRSDQAAPFSAVEPALAACAEAGIEDIALAVYGKEGQR
jgi:biopolymer transport protein ExbD